MSIVEKAIAKLQTAGGAPANESKQSQAPQHAAHTPAAVPRPEEAPLTTAASVTADLHALQAAGMLPPAHGALMVRNQFRRLKWSLLDEIDAARGKGEFAHPGRGGHAEADGTPRGRGRKARPR